MPCRYIVAGPSGSIRIFYDSLTEKFLLIFSSGTEFWATPAELESYLDTARKRGARVTELEAKE